MIHEKRHITFPRGDVANALSEFRRVNHQFLPQGEITILELRPNGTVRIKINMTYGGNKQVAFFDVPATDVVRALVNACVALKIPMPRHGKKTLSVGQNDVYLSIAIDAKSFSEANEVVLEGETNAQRVQPPSHHGAGIGARAVSTPSANAPLKAAG